MNKYFVSWTVNLKDYTKYTTSDIIESDADNLEDLVENVKKQLIEYEKLETHGFITINIIIPEHQMFKRG